MKLRMVMTKRGSIDGIHIQTYYQGEEYDLPPDLAHAFLSLKCAEPVEGKIQEEIIPEIEPVVKKKSVKRKKKVMKHENK